MNRRLGEQPQYNITKVSLSFAVSWPYGPAFQRTIGARAQGPGQDRNTRVVSGHSAACPSVWDRRRIPYLLATHQANASRVEALPDHETAALGALTSQHHGPKALGIPALAC